MYGRVPLGRNSQIYDAEILGAVSGLRAACVKGESQNRSSTKAMPNITCSTKSAQFRPVTACSHWMARFARNVFVCLDNEEAAIRLHTDSPTPSSSTQIQEFQSLRRIWSERERPTTTD
ncbi:hypothetical protein EPUL_005665, partial [Erysiphe pulchra]